MAIKAGQLFPINEYLDRHHHIEATGEFRNPKAGEWFISGAIPEGYRASRDLSTPYDIGRLVQTRTRTITEKV